MNHLEVRSFFLCATNLIYIIGLNGNAVQTVVFEVRQESTRETDLRRSPSGLTAQFLLPQQRRALQQVEEARKGFG